MEKLVVMSDDGSPQEFPLIEKRLLIGRDESCKICLRDRSVSRHHATLMRVFRGFSVEDEQSTNGTKVNGTVITKRFLKHGDLIEVGKYRMRYIAQLPDQDMDDDPDRTIVLRPNQPTDLPPPSVAPIESKPAAVAPHVQSTPPPVAPVSQSVSSSVVNEPSDLPAETVPGSDPQAKVRFLSGEQKGEEKVVDRAFFSVGKPGGDLVLINRRQSGFFLLKVGGDNTPMINGESIRAGGVELNNGDRVDLGELSLEFVSDSQS
ncbi:MAG: FHA domain-containing protein [Candidatus Thiodiazotropha sp. (ex Lucinoma annulata)]|nr:FHA domain-containing protein [Candidatus Thiodiazotropha sp. (ex Lucinoma borealis)]MCU7841447.1 FHA domain-containing protein [Candidatus Thiodiazotropha sp. (ex Troendleina suluensis)]MCU7865796.1 FHA domain-containing protein [Candidatus Thiodiazotropha sp. (ex Lucinoma borealis)]MCU7885946.1 FHA domain-containing protein [Candidatus Thiodiazotropha sp. (ex Lucinoma annulata)]